MSPAVLGEQLAIDFPMATTSFEVTYLRRDQILPDPEQPRAEADADLRASIARNGILQPITVRPHPTLARKYFLVDGERRWRGSEGILDALPCLVREDQDNAALRLRTQLVANTGKPLSPLEEARAFAKLLEAQGEERSIEQLSAELGRPVSSIHERLGLLELGPWIPWIEDGTIGLSHAVKVLLPLRGCAESVHLHALSVVEKDYRFTREHGGMSLSAFTQVAQQAYRAQLYPLTKTKTSYEPQPLFDTKRHDDECDCGRVMFALGSSDAKRACCGDPAWWRPLHRKAKAAQPKKPSTTDARRGREPITLPAGAKSLKVGWGANTKGLVQLTRTYESKWEVEDFDPSALRVAPEKLTLVTTPGGTYVATSDLAAVKEARRMWRDQWQQRRRVLVDGIISAMPEKSKAYRVAGPGVGEMLVWLTLNAAALADACLIARVAAPAGYETWSIYERQAHLPAIAKLTDAECEKVATVLAYLFGTKTAFPSGTIHTQLEKEKNRIMARRLPWLGTPKAATKAKGTKRVAPAAALEEEEEWDEAEEDEE